MEISLLGYQSKSHPTKETTVRAMSTVSAVVVRQRYRSVPHATRRASSGAPAPPPAGRVINDMFMTRDCASHTMCSTDREAAVPWA